MLKTIIFDLDNTLMEWEEEYIIALEKTLEKLKINFPKEMIIEIDKAITDSEKYSNIHTKESLLNHINKRCNLNLPLEFVDILLEQQKIAIDNSQKKRLILLNI